MLCELIKEKECYKNKKMEKEKYYTPEIEEFCVGFEYEVNLGSDWVRTKLDVNWKLGGETILKLNDNKPVRVKYLDQEDIESLGWKQITKSKYSRDFDDVSYKIYHNEISNICIIKEFQENDTYETATSIFNGTIKNKSELKKLLKMLKITDNQ